MIQGPPPLLTPTAPITGGGNLTGSMTVGVDAMTGDAGSGGTSGVVPAPGAGDAGKYLSGAATWVDLTVDDQIIFAHRIFGG